jgi:hypothetical protein
VVSVREKVSLKISGADQGDEEMNRCRSVESVVVRSKPSSGR